MSPDNINSSKAVTKDDNQAGSGSRKPASNNRPPEQGLKCPRCDSPNTKFCYYNNYSLTQPRHFCKTCRRYWTKGGALRNVPIGGGCRKNKKVKSSSSLKDPASSDPLTGLKFFHGLSHPAIDFQLGGLSLHPRFHHSPTTSTAGIYNNNALSSFGDPIASSPSCFTLDPTGGFNYPFCSSSSGTGLNGAVQNVISSSVNVNSSLASSIESLSSLNQDMHWKLQQQRMAMLFGNADSSDINNGNSDNSHQKEINIMSRVVIPGAEIEGQAQIKPQPIPFQNLEISKTDGSRRELGTGSGDNATEWFFGNSYGPVSGPVTPTATSSSGNGNVNGNDNSSNFAAVPAWGDLHQHYTSLP